MAYPTVSKTYGFKPVNRVDGLPYAGAIRQIPVAAAYATAILNGDTVSIDTNGYLVAKTTSNSGDSVGVLVGCQYVNSNGQTVEGQYSPAAASTIQSRAVSATTRMPLSSTLSTNVLTSPVSTMLLPPPKMNLGCSRRVSWDNRA